MKLAPKTIVLGVNSVSADGGIAQVARNLIKVLKTKVRDEPHLYDVKTITCFRGRENKHNASSRSVIAKVRFFLAIRKSFFSSTHFIYDSCNMAQIHPQIFVMRRRPYLTYIHGIEVWESAKPRWLRACHRSDFLVSNSLYTKNRADKLHGGFSRAQVCGLGTTTDDVPADTPPLRVRKPNVVIVGRIDSGENYKGHLELIQSWPDVLSVIPEAKLHVVGAGSGLHYLRQAVIKATLENRIVFHGHVSDKRLEELYAQCRVFAMPSRNEGFGLVYIEAMRHGLPVVASTHDAAGEIVIHGRTGLTVNLDRPNDLSSSIVRLLKNPEYAELMGNAGQTRWKEHFTFTKFKSRFLLILEEFFSTKNRVD